MKNLYTLLSRKNDPKARKPTQKRIIHYLNINIGISKYEYKYSH